ncbi:hypothetical protein ACWEQL_11860 [Kitasatospora sp. NPDC004240]
MKYHRKPATPSPGDAAHSRHQARPQHEASADRSYGDRASGTRSAPTPAPDHEPPRERYDATAEATRTAADIEGEDGGT